MPTPVLASLALVLCVTQASSVLATEHDSIEGKWYERSFEQLLDTKIITATRSEKSIDQSPSMITVYTEADIKRMGIRSIKELLERTTGFFTNKQLAGPAIGSRGFIGDNEQFLLLIDGHSVNSIADKGPGNFFLFPFLEHVKRVEIQRGPGSTLWGSDAALGIIHIITQDGEDIDGVVTTYSQSSEDNQRYIHARGGESVAEDVSYMFSFTAAESEGFSDDILVDAGNWEEFDDSWEFYLKAKLKNTTIYARATDQKNNRPGGSQNAWAGIEEQAYARRRHTFLDIKHNRQLSESFDIEARFFTDMIEQWQSMINPVITEGAEIVEESAATRENSLGTEVIGRWETNSNHNFLFGFRAVRTEVDPVSNNFFLPTHPKPPNPLELDAVVSMRVIPESTDENMALFIEDDWAINEKLNFIAGVRIDSNTLREESTIVLPRFGLNWKISPQWTAQYSYTTGYIRPPVAIGFLGQAQPQIDPVWATSSKIYGAPDSEQVYNHDVRISFNRKPFSAKWNLYHTTIDDSFNFIAEKGVVDGETRELYFINTATIKTYGSEFEFNYVPSKTWSLYGNFSYVIDSKLDEHTGTSYGVDYNLNSTVLGFGEGAFLKDGTVVGYPHQIWNLGVNYFFGDQLSANLHYRGWSDLVTRDRVGVAGEFGAFDRVIGEGTEEFGPEHYVDFNIRYEKVAGTKLDAALFVKNLLDNDDAETGMLYFIQSWTGMGRSVGVNLSYTF